MVEASKISSAQEGEPDKWRDARSSPPEFRKRSFADGRRWPIRPEAIAALIDVGLTDQRLAEYFGVRFADVRALRMRCAHGD